MGKTPSYDESEAKQEAAIYRTPAAADRREQAARDATFFSFTQYCYLVRNEA